MQIRFPCNHNKIAISFSKPELLRLVFLAFSEFLMQKSTRKILLYMKDSLRQLDCMY